MARIRTIKPDFFASEDVSALPLRARLTWIGLWTQCDDHGRTKRNAKLVKAAVWPLDDVSLRDVEEDLNTLAHAGRIVTYEVGSTPLLAVVNWHVHQSINRVGKARHPGPPVPIGVPDPADPNYCAECAQPGSTDGLAPAEQYVSEPRGTTATHETLTEPSVSVHGALTPGREGKGKERKGRAREEPLSRNGTRPLDSEPPLTCPKHLENPRPPPCGACADARRANERWHADKRTRQANAPKCPEHPGQLAHNCGCCAGARKGAA